MPAHPILPRLSFRGRENDSPCVTFRAGLSARPMVFVRGISDLKFKI
jgi:hypothetical protein